MLKMECSGSFQSTLPIVFPQWDEVMNEYMKQVECANRKYIWIVENPHTDDSRSLRYQGRRSSHSKKSYSYDNLSMHFKLV